MVLAARRYVRRVLLGHLLLLAVVLLIVAGAVRYLYHSSRQQAIDEAKSKQKLLSRQTALGVQNYYESVTNVLELLQPEITTTAEEEPTTAPAESAPPSAQLPQQQP